MAWWSTTWERLRATALRPSAADPTRPAADPVAVPVTGPMVQRHPDWPTASPMPRVIAAHPLVAPLEPFTAALATHRSPAFLAPLEHVVTPDMGGVVDGLATVAGTSGGGGGNERSPHRVVAAAPVAQRSVDRPDPVPAGVAAAPPTSGRAGPSIGRPGGESLVRAADPGPLRELPVVARLTDPAGGGQPPAPRTGAPRADLPAQNVQRAHSRPTDLEPGPLEPGPLEVAERALTPRESSSLHPVPAAPPASGGSVSPALPARPVVARSVADVSGATPVVPSGRSSVLEPAAALAGSRVSPPAAALPVVAAAIDRSHPGALGSRPAPSAGPLGPVATTVQRASPDFGPPVVDAAGPAFRSSDGATAEPSAVAPASTGSPSRPTFGLGAPLIDTTPEVPSASAPVAVGFGAFPFGADHPESAAPERVDAASSAGGPPGPLLSVSRSAVDEAVLGEPLAGSDPRAGARPGIPSITNVGPTQFTSRRSDDGPSAAPAMPAAASGSVTNTGAGPAIRQRTAASLPILGSGWTGLPADSGSAGEAAVRAGVAQRAVDGSYVFPPPAPWSPPDTGTATATLGADRSGPAGAPTSRPGAAGPLPLLRTVSRTAVDAPTVPVVQRRWGSDALNPGALANQLHSAVPAAPTMPALPSLSSVPSVPPSLPTVPSLPGAPDLLPSVPGLVALPSVPTLPDAPTLPTLPSLPGTAAAAIPGVPSLPTVPMPTLPAVSLPTVPGLPAPSVPGSPSPLATLPALPSVPALPSAPALPPFPGLPAVPGFPSGPPSTSNGGAPSGLPLLPAAAGAASASMPGGGDPAVGAVDPSAGTPGPAPAPAPTPAPPDQPAAGPTGASAPAGHGSTAAAATGFPAVAGSTGPGIDVDDLARRLIDPISARLRTELWLDRERAGLLLDL